MGKKIQGYIIGALHKPKNEEDEKYVGQLDIWKLNNSKLSLDQLLY